MRENVNGIRASPKKVVIPPFIPKSQETDPRDVFFEHDEYQRLKDALPNRLKPVLMRGYLTGISK